MEEEREDTQFFLEKYRIGSDIRVELMEAFDLFVDNNELVRDFKLLVSDTTYYLPEKNIEISPETEREIKEKNLKKIAIFLKTVSLKEEISFKEKREIILRLRTSFECRPEKIHPILEKWVGLLDIFKK